MKGSYISHRMQNEFISLIGDYLEERVLNRVRKALFFSILAETALVSLTISAWYDEESTA